MTNNKKNNNSEKSRVTPPDAARVHRHTLIEINLSVFTARRDAAHQSVLDILRRKMLSSNKEIREVLYSLCVRFLDDAIECTKRSQVQPDSPVLHYLNLLKDTISASMASTTISFSRWWATASSNHSQSA